MPVQVHGTPNPNARKYTLTERRFAASHNLSSAEAAAAHPPAGSLFALDGVYNVLLAQDFVTVNKRPDVAWEPLEADILRVLNDWIGGV